MPYEFAQNEIFANKPRLWLYEFISPFPWRDLHQNALQASFVKTEHFEPTLARSILRVY